MRAIRLGLAVALAAFATSAFAADVPAPALPPPPTAPQAIKPVKPELFMVTGAGGNVTVRVTPAGLVVVDGKNPGQQVYDDLMAQIRTVSQEPVKVMIVTHHHADHSGNTGRFAAADAAVTAHKNLGGLLERFTPAPTAGNTVPPTKPTVTYDTTHTVSLGGKSVRLFHYAPAHTGADTIVYFPDLKVVAMGDELNAANPNFDYASGASVGGWIRSLDATLGLDWDRAIPGHGAEPWTRDQVRVFRGKLQTLLDRARASAKAGTSKAGFVASLKADDLWSFPANFWNAMRTDGLYAEAGGQ
ncbi:MAG: MBL fold metallo-hydrolase [Phenylobacterium sp.]|uniref:MBL fold metallo-hydrolase n=1 Tax=Phenylobacterium sp. TaxID=1871053 RepID=UPI001A467C7E|nr:MBL fold metallo-hydrolase [Phenylobacterium sp.]MBL8556664.1 MBL fold metallo-hydrolase [Phenylobacterium sp.]